MSIFGIDDSVHSLTAFDLQLCNINITQLLREAGINRCMCVEQHGEPAGGHLESQWLNAVDVIRVVANDSRHASLSDLLQLSQGERPSLVHAKVIEELVPFLQSGKLVPDDALEYWAKD